MSDIVKLSLKHARLATTRCFKESADQPEGWITPLRIAAITHRLEIHHSWPMCTRAFCDLVPKSGLSDHLLYIDPEYHALRTRLIAQRQAEINRP